MNSSFPLRNPDGKQINGYTLCLGEIRQLHLSGWKQFQLHVQDLHGAISRFPVFEGIYSFGGKDGVKPWMDLEYCEELMFMEGETIKDSFSLSFRSLDRKLFGYLGDMIPPGGHLMVSYEREQRIHVDTLKSLNLGIPPALTPLGLLIFLGGFQLIKDWYLAEGGHEGPRKLWGEKAPNQKWAQSFYGRTAQEILRFLSEKSDSAHEELEKSAMLRSKEILKAIKRKRSRSPGYCS